MSVEGGKETLLQNDLIQKKSECRMFLWPAFDTIKTLRYMQGREGVASLFLEEETCNEVAVKSASWFVHATFNQLQRFPEM